MLPRVKNKQMNKKFFFKFRSNAPHRLHRRLASCCARQCNDVINVMAQAPLRAVHTTQPVVQPAEKCKQRVTFRSPTMSKLRVNLLFSSMTKRVVIKPGEHRG